MGASREGRNSERTFGLVLDAMRHLTVQVWLPRADEFEEDAARVKRLLDQVVAEMKAESFTSSATYDEGRPRRCLVQTPDEYNPELKRR